MKQYWPAPERNKDPILARLTDILGPLDPGSTVLEVASGTGQHAVHFAGGLAHLLWQPSDPSPENRDSIEAWRLDGPSNMQPPLNLDVCHEWPDLSVSAIVNINMIHIAPWEATLALFAGSNRHLEPGAPLVLYGPFQQNGMHTAPSNASFDASLRERDPSWGVRDLEEVTRVAEASGFTRVAVHTMPANNLLVHFICSS